MRYALQGTWWTVCLAVALWGCNRGEQPPKPEQKPAPPAVAEKPQPAPEPTPPAVETPVPAEPAPPPKIPDVVMTEAQAATGLVKVADPMPEGELPDLEGKPHAIKDLLGQKGTVIVFWDAADPYGVQELQDLQLDVVEPYGGQGINVVGINEKDSPDTVRQKLEQTGAKFTQLLDSDGAYFAKVAKERLPRTYLLDREGKILWLDLEYSSATRRNLLQAIKVVVSQGQDVAR
jgi:peroxiredoxin